MACKSPLVGANAGRSIGRGYALRQDALEEATTLVHPERSKAPPSILYGTHAGRVGRTKNKNRCHGQHASARMSNTRTDFYTWHAKPADGRGRTRRLNKGHTTGRGSTPVVVAEWRGTTSLGPIPAVLTKNICCPARHMRITLVVPCVKYRSWVRFAARCIRRSDAPSTPRAI